MIAFVDLSVPITFAIHPDRSLVVVTRLRRTTFEEWSEALTDLLSNPSFRPGFHVVEDARAVVAVPGSITTGRPTAIRLREYEARSSGLQRVKIVARAPSARQARAA